MHGVQLIAKTKPNKTDDKKPVKTIFLPELSLDPKLKKGMLIKPIKLKPSKIIIEPLTMFKTAAYSTSNPPITPANAPSETNSTVKPETKPNTLTRAFRLSPSSILPAKKYDTYTGSNGRMHGEMNVIIPSKNVIK